MLVLGINTHHGDASAGLIEDGKIVAAVAEERFTRNKHEGGFPRHAIGWCLRQTNKKVSHVAISRNPSVFRIRKIGAIIKNPFLLKQWYRRKNNMTEINHIGREVEQVMGHSVILHKIEHHFAHLAYGYITSDFDQCNLLFIDGFGDFVSTACGKASGSKIEINKRIFFPDSIGVFYTAITQFLGFSGYGEEYKVMALASFGKPRYKHLFSEIIIKNTDGFKLTNKYFSHTKGGAEMTYGVGTPIIGRLFTRNLELLLGPARSRGQILTERHYDIAATLQEVVNEMVLHLAEIIRNKNESGNLVVSGGVAQNSVANGILERSGLFENYWFSSAPADDGTAIGAAATVALSSGDTFHGKNNGSPFLGPGSGDRHPDNANLIKPVIELLNNGKIVGWFEGEAEFGPRALGHRSILADPRVIGIKDRINAVVKKRENFRPFAPMVLFEDVSKYFDMKFKSPNMMTVAMVKNEWRNRLASITHIDGSARVQTVEKTLLPNIATLLEGWREKTGIGVLLNTSFNENEPIVNTPEEAISCFRRTKLDALAINGKLFVK